MSRAVQTEAGTEILPSHLEPITTNRTTRSRTQKPSTSRLSHTDPSSTHLSECKPSSVTKTTQPSVSAKPTKSKTSQKHTQSQPYSKKLEQQKKKKIQSSSIDSVLFESMDAIDDISDDQYETDLDPPHSPRPTGPPFIGSATHRVRHS